MNNFNAVIVHNVVSLYIKPDPDSEPETQCLLGESVNLVGSEQRWVLIKTRYGNEGWAKNHTVREYSEDEAAYASGGNRFFVNSLFTDVLTSPTDDSDIITKATYGVALEVCGEKNGYAELRLPDDSRGYVYLGDIVSEKPDYSPDFVIRQAKQFIGVPYLWGGKSPFGIDCSGLVQLIHESCEVNLPRNSYVQAESDLTKPVERENIDTGDLVFFSNNGIRVTHVGIALDCSEFIHSCGSYGVSISEFREPYYNRTFWSARRVI